MQNNTNNRNKTFGHQFRTYINTHQSNKQNIQTFFRQSILYACVPNEASNDRKTIYYFHFFWVFYSKMRKKQACVWCISSQTMTLNRNRLFFGVFF